MMQLAVAATAGRKSVRTQTQRVRCDALASFSQFQRRRRICPRMVLNDAARRCDDGGGWLAGWLVVMMMVWRTSCRYVCASRCNANTWYARAAIRV